MKIFQRAATDQAGVVLWILVEVESQGSRLLGFHDLAGSLPDISLDTASSDGPYNRAIVAHQHFAVRNEGIEPRTLTMVARAPRRPFAPQLDDLS